MMANQSTQIAVNSGGWLHARDIDQAKLASLKEKPDGSVPPSCSYSPEAVEFPIRGIRAFNSFSI